MTDQLPADEEALALQTIEMFEVITQSNPSDHESLEILKEAYFKLSRARDAIDTSKRIAQAYAQSGKFSSAILEYESILQSSPKDPDAQKALEALENRTTQLAAPEEPIETAVPKALPVTAPRGQEVRSQPPLTDFEDGRVAMRKLLVDGKHLSGADFDLYWKSPDLRGIPQEPSEPFIQILADKQLLDIDASLKLINEKSRLSFLPLDKYDVDVELAREFPRETCLRWSIMPFDRMSKSILVATSNPFNERAMRELENFNRQTSLANRFIWYLAAPADLIKTLRKTFR